MASQYVSEIDGVQIQHDDVELFTMLEFGQANYWTADKMANELERVLPALQKKFFWAQLMLQLDHSSCHGARSPDSLDVKQMGSKPGGAGPLMRDTIFTHKTTSEQIKQAMVDENGVSKGLVRVLEERGEDVYMRDASNAVVHTKAGKANIKTKEELQQILAAYDDFAKETHMIQDICDYFGVLLLMSPRGHCELSEAEPVFAIEKRLMEDNCDFTMAGLRRSFLLAIQSVCLQSVKRIFGRCERFRVAYRLIASPLSALNMECLADVMKIAGHR